VTLRALTGLALGATLALSACGPVATAGPGCRPVRTAIELPPQLRETSGAAVSLDHPGVIWSHNDAGSRLFALDREGALLGTWHLPVRLRDWEDLSLSSCGEGRSCLYIADLGDNYEERRDVRLLRVPEPDPDRAPDPGPGPAGRGDADASPPAPGDTLEAEFFPVRLPDGPRDIEALVVLPGERILAVTKGRNHPQTVYRYPGPLRPDTVTLEAVQRLGDGPRILPRQITGGSADPGGRVALRTYEALRFYRLEGDTLRLEEDGTVNLRTLEEPQGEGVGLGLGGEVALTSEGGPGGGPASMNLLRCEGGTG